MKRLLRKAALLALGLTAAPAFAQELEFRAVKLTRSPDEAVMIGQPLPSTRPAGFIARGKVNDDAISVVGEPAKSNDKLQAPFPVVQAPSTDFVAPPPHIVPNGSEPSAVVAPNVVAPNVVVPNGAQPSPFGAIPGREPSNGQTPRGYSAPYSPGYPITGHPNPCGCGVCSGFELDPVGMFQGLFGAIHTGISPLFEPLNGECDTCGVCRPRYWVRGELIAWSLTRPNVPPLVTTAPSVAQLPLNSGASTVVFDQHNLSDDTMYGGRLTLGFWFPNRCDWGFEASFFKLDPQTSNFFITSPPATAIGLPFIGSGPGEPASNVLPIAGPGVPGSVVIQNRTQLWGFDLDLRHKLWEGPRWWLDGLVGYRYLQLTDDFSLHAAGNVAGTAFTIDDRFNAQNSFNGAQIGLEGEWLWRPRWSVGSFIKLAVGNTTEIVNIQGQTVNNGVSRSVGAFALPTNSGRFQRNDLAVLPEFGIKLNYDITEHWRAYVGYNVLYLSSVMRATEQIDPRINSTQVGGTLTGTPLPAVLLKRSDFTAQGVNFGLECHY
jgi:hypothetical protein